MADKNEDVTFVPEAQTPRSEPTIAADVEQLQEEIKSELEDIKSMTGGTSTWFLRGIMQGAGAIVGSILMLIFLGWLLSILGFIPGLGEISEFFGGYVERVSR